MITVRYSWCLQQLCLQRATLDLLLVLTVGYILGVYSGLLWVLTWAIIGTVSGLLLVDAMGYSWWL